MRYDGLVVVQRIDDDSQAIFVIDQSDHVAIVIENWSTRDPFFKQSIGYIEHICIRFEGDKLRGHIVFDYLFLDWRIFFDLLLIIILATHCSVFSNFRMTSKLSDLQN